MANFDVKESIDTKSISTGVSTAGDNIVPMTGDIIMFAGTTIPAGWTLCNGLFGSPDLRDDFVVGANASGNIGAAAGSATHSHTYAFGNPGYGNSSFSHGAYNVGAFSTNNSHSDHSHTWSFTVTTSTFVGSANFVQATDGTGTSKCLRTGHRHVESFSIGTNNMVVSANDNSAATPNHNHNVGTFTRDNSETHTHTVLAASASGNVSASAVNVPYLALYYIMKL